MLRAGYRAVCTENFSYSTETDSEDAWLADTGGITCTKNRQYTRSSDRTSSLVSPMKK